MARNNNLNNKPTLQDVATSADVSTATVSRCLNSPDLVKKAVRERINQTIKQLGYVPHGAARALASKRTRSIGVVVPTIDNAIFATAIQALQLVLIEANYTLLLASNNYSLLEESRSVNSLLTRGIDAIVLIGEDHDPNALSAIKRQQIPYVNLWIHNPKSYYSCIGFDNINAGEQIAKHLCDLGHNDIAIISGFIENNDRALHRINGAREYFKTQKRTVTKVIECKYSIDKGRAAIHTIMKQHPETTAILCGNDILAIGAIAGARDLGLKVPEDISISGFDNIEIASALEKSLTTIDTPAKKMGTEAASFLLRHLDKKNQKTEKTERTELEAKLIIRETTAKPRLKT